MANAEGQRALSHSPIKGRDRHISGPRSASGAPFRVFFLCCRVCVLCCAGSFTRREISPECNHRGPGSCTPGHLMTSRTVAN